MEVEYGAEHGRLARRLFDSADVGWRSLRLQVLAVPGEADDVHLDGIDAQLIDLQVRGGRRIHSRRARGWTSGALEVGMLSTTAPGNPSQLRWTATDGDAEIEQIRVLLPARTLSRLHEEMGRAASPGQGPPDALTMEDSFLRSFLQQLRRAAGAGMPDLYAASAAEFLGMHLLTQYGTVPVPPQPPRADDRIARVVDVLHAHLDVTLDLAELSAVAGLSRFHLLRLFRQHTGETPAHYHRRLRIEYSQRLLRTTALPVGDIATRCGFADHAHFARTFRASVGASPSTYRAAQRG